MHQLQICRTVKNYGSSDNKVATVTAEELDEMLKKKTDLFVLDVRNKEEFTNQVKKDTWKNRGHIQNAVNIPASELESRWSEISDKKNA